MKMMDGGIGTYLWELGFPYTENPSLANLTHPHLVEQLHKEYQKAGAEILLTNTFQAGPQHLPPRVSSKELTAQGVLLAKKAGNAQVALSIGPSGFSLEENTKAEQYYCDMVGAGVVADILLFESCLSIWEAELAASVAKSCSNLPIWLSFCISSTGKTYGNDTIAEVIIATEEWGISAIGLNCSYPPKELYPYAEKLAQQTELPTFFYPNKGLPEETSGKPVYKGTSKAFAEALSLFLPLRPMALGGCCGTTPKEIALFSPTIKSP